MQSIRSENIQLQKSIQNYLEEIEKQKQLNAQHESQIETLLKFNERLLGIIQNQLNNNNKKDNVSLQPISERSERQSDLMNTPTIQSFIKTRKNTVARSERGSPTKQSLIDRAHISGNKLNLFEKEALKSEMEHSIPDQQQSQYKLDVRPNLASEVRKIVNESNEVNNQMKKQIQQFQQYSNQSSKFYNNKIAQLRNLNDKLSNYHPLDQFDQISKKVALSPETANLVRKAMMKNMM